MSDARAAAPMPAAARPNNWRRVSISSYSLCGSILYTPAAVPASALGDRLVQVQDDTRDGGPGGQLDGVQLLVPLRLADHEQLDRRITILAEGGLLLVQEAEQHLH